MVNWDKSDKADFKFVLLGLYIHTVPTYIITYSNIKMKPYLCKVVQVKELALLLSQFVLSQHPIRYEFQSLLIKLRKEITASVMHKGTNF